MTHAPSVVDLSLSRRHVRLILLLAAAGSVTLLVTTAFVRVGRPLLGETFWWAMVAPQVSLIGEKSIAAWYASSMLLLVAGAFVLCHLAEQTGGGRRRWGWLVVAAGFAALSLDEAGSIHERTGQLGSLNLVGSAAQTWAGVLALPFVVCTIFLAVFAWSRLRRHPLVFALLCVGTLLFASVFVQEELEARIWNSGTAEAGADGELARRPLHMLLIEEGSELGASLVFLTAAFIYAHRASAPDRTSRGLGDIRAAVHPRALRLASRLVALGLLAGLIAAAIVQLAIPPPSHRGDPVPWFSAMAALLAGGAAWLLPRSERAIDGRLVLSAVCLLWSLDQGAGFLFTDNIWTGSPRAELATQFALAFVTIAGMGYVLRGSFTPPLRRRIFAWAVMLAAASLAGHPIGIAALVFGGCTVLLLGIVDERLVERGYG